MMKLPKVEPWAMLPDGRVVRVVIHRDNLNARQKRFAQEYVRDGNGTWAAIRAGYAGSSAPVHAHRLLKNDKVREEIRKCQRRLQLREEVASDLDTISRLKQVTFFDIGSFFDRNGKLLPRDKMPDDTRLALDLLAARESVKGGLRAQRVKVADKLVAFYTLTKSLGMAPFAMFHLGTFPIGMFPQ